ncbi:TIGR04283 family arsenosugar biosynthesis glycosyltransferase [Reichenbachiella carrageenanivorans]|uniref:TIGR04283 family arsenosugar biosynthesis glycosyltransferase n=1 Tax=Reichenbachiella carrageenanivorans TaxID=2979869 RepID=A0ABY6CWV8_9BACT|nr:TIGR04283 family arsenosugar biosynthesis glycosyltransferase [Reichenbachiella carrageenanivorans]UXX78353.1 TIGR04283 family arsenosugar biosynthesis glycosyltransferase [Reichenbachiella carrageenanivorans]
MDLSIIIPTLNESAYIQRTLSSIRSRASGRFSYEIIIVDAGSTDDTKSIAARLVDVFYEDAHLAGAKYKSLNKGAAMAKGDDLLFLDADTLLPLAFDLHIKQVLEDSKIVGGAFEFQMDGQRRIYRIIEWINRMRYRIDQRYFGDQGIFCRRADFWQLGGYPPEPIMEAAYFCKRMSQQGRLALVKSPILTAARRFEAGQVFRVFFKDTWIWIQFTLGLDVKKYASAYWQENKNRG